MANIQPISSLRNYRKVVKEVSFGNRVHLTVNGYGSVVMIDEKELELLDELVSPAMLLRRLQKSEERADKEGWISEEDFYKKLEDEE